eukprot:gnl/MRDRNA2_/MRDRNA2_119264_c0_seq1.p1 gnl/MRDRNA2_/MRDRNA2_119264_c0~~gnl/MRDRNA2_/MRDRNA2_119264_c0_seq1.p1  ORF type:complete len:561 (-),score=109.25 gnl/MRDRNA2_/MRDRNA2_119264_c0_seq1:46-1728(-)
MVKTATVANEPIPIHVVGNSFAKQYYTLLARAPDKAFKFYKEHSQVTWQKGKSQVVARGQEDIRKCIKEMWGEGNDITSEAGLTNHFQVSSITSQESANGLIIVLVSGTLELKGPGVCGHRCFSQTFSLEKQTKPYDGYYCLNDMLQFLPNFFPESFKAGTLQMFDLSAKMRSCIENRDAGLRNGKEDTSMQTFEEKGMTLLSKIDYGSKLLSRAVDLINKQADGGEVNEQPDGGQVPAFLDLDKELEIIEHESDWINMHHKEWPKRVENLLNRIQAVSRLIAEAGNATASVLSSAPPGLIPHKFEECMQSTCSNLENLQSHIQDRISDITDLQHEFSSFDQHVFALQAAQQNHVSKVKDLITKETQKITKAAEDEITKGWKKLLELNREFIRQREQAEEKERGTTLTALEEFEKKLKYFGIETVMYNYPTILREFQAERPDFNNMTLDDLRSVIKDLGETKDGHILDRTCQSKKDTEKESPKSQELWEQKELQIWLKVTIRMVKGADDKSEDWLSVLKQRWQQAKEKIPEEMRAETFEQLKKHLPEGHNLSHKKLDEML